MINGWTKENAVNYCIDVMNKTLQVNNLSNIEKVLSIYQHCFSNNQRERFYKSLWKNTVVVYIESIMENDSLDTRTLETHRKNLKIYSNANSASEFLENMNELFSITFGETAESPVLAIRQLLKEYLKNKYKKLLEQDITGPECLMNYIYYHADTLILPSSKEENKWILPDSILIGLIRENVIGINSQSTNTFKVSETCCFCSTGIVTKAFAYQESLYGWKVYRTCKDCEDFKNYCNYYLHIGYVNSSEVIVNDLVIKDNCRLDYEDLIRTLKK